MGRRFSTKRAIKRAEALLPDFGALQGQQQAAKLGWSKSRWSQVKSGRLNANQIDQIVHLCVALQIDMPTFLVLGGIPEGKVAKIMPHTDHGKAEVSPTAGGVSVAGKVSVGKHNGENRGRHSPRQEGIEGEHVRTIIVEWSQPSRASLPVPLDDAGLLPFGDASSFLLRDARDEGVRDATNSSTRKWRVQPKTPSGKHGRWRKALVDHAERRVLAA